MSLSYTKADGIGRKIIPASLINIGKQYIKNNDGTRIGTNYELTLTGTLLPFRGSPSGNYTDIDDAFWTIGGYPPDQTIGNESDAFNSILRKQEALRNLFNEEGGSLEWQPSGGQPVVKCNPSVVSIDFQEDTWVDRCEYSIRLEAPWIFINGTSDLEDSFSQDLIKSSSESWSFEEIEGRNGKQFNVSHTINAEGLIGYSSANNKLESKEAWEHARDYVNLRVSGSIDSSIMFAALGATNKTQSQYVKSTNVDKTNGSYEITEKWLLSDETTYTEQRFNVEFDTDVGEYNVTYEGTIIGLSAGTRQGDSLNMQVAKLAIPTNPQAKTITEAAIGTLLGGKSIPSTPQNTSFALDQQNGTVNFTFRWNTSDSTTVTIVEEAQYNFSLDNNLHTVSLTESIEPFGDTSAIKVSNAKAAIYTDSFAYSRAILLLAGQIPAGVTIESVKLSKTLSINEKTGSTRVSWSWNSRDIHNTEVTIQTQEPNQVIASIAIPGRAAGPIIQDMQTVTSRIVTVTIRSRNHNSQPDLETEVFSNGIIIGDNTSWNPQTLNAERTTRFLEET